MSVLDIFLTLSKIPHCSHNTQKLKNFIIDWARSYGFETEVDSAGNILAYKQKRDYTLQSHYDMVCVGRAPKIEVVQQNGFLMARESSLGADNGIGVAIMLKLMSQGVEAEYLFTNDEEVGLVGAKELSFELRATKMINLDSEEFGNIYVGCAGGVDFEAVKPLEYEEDCKEVFEVELCFSGGHSGVDIDKNIPNAIKELAFLLKNHKIAHIEGGERINSIPSKVRALIFEKIKEAKKLDEKRAAIKGDILAPILAFANGVRGWSREFDIPQDSINLAKIKSKDGILKIEISARSMSEEGLKRLTVESEAFFKGFGFSFKSYGYYPPWEPRVTDFSKEVQNSFRAFVKEPKLKAIHAGLESAIFAKKFPSMQIVSIGPDIFYPHSIQERVKIDTIEPLFELVKGIICD